MLSVGFEPTIPASERAKTVHALDRLAAVTSRENLTFLIRDFFNKAVINSNCLASNVRMFCELNWAGCQMEQSWSNLRDCYIPAFTWRA
jgi:hypothetical protein